MEKYKVVLIYPDGTREEEDELFDTYDEAEDYGLECCGNYKHGAEMLNLSNPGDYPLDDDDELEYEVIEIDD